MKKGNRYVGFYSLIAMLDVAVIAMFLIILAPSPPSTQIVNSRHPVTRIVVAITGTPERIVISSLGIDLPVSVGSYDPVSGGWTLGNTGVYYADTSVPVNNNNGVTLIYGHDLVSIFGHLFELQSGASADVYTDTHHIFHYRYQSVRNVEPTDTSIFTTSGPPVLALQTCTGDWDAYRAIYSFNYVGESAT